MFVNIELLKDLFISPGLQPSGKYATAEDNSLRGLIMLMYAWYTTHEHNFFENVCPVVYGDDMLCAVKPDFVKSFNNNMYQKFCMDHYNMKFTNALKTSVMSDFMPVEEMSFLKRKFHVHPLLNKMVAQLDKDSLIKTLEWIIPSNHIIESEQVKQCIIAVLWELSLQVTQENFEIFREELIIEFLKAYPESNDSKIPTYKSILMKIFPGHPALDTVDEQKEVSMSTEYLTPSFQQMFQFIYDLE